MGGWTILPDSPQQSSGWTVLPDEQPALSAPKPAPVKAPSSYQIQAEEPTQPKPAGPPMISTRRILRQVPQPPESAQPTVAQKAVGVLEGIPVVGSIAAAPFHLAGVKGADPLPAQEFEGERRQRAEIGGNYRPEGVSGEVADDIRSVRDNLLRQPFGMGEAIQKADVPWWLGSDLTKGAATAAAGLVDSPEAILTLGALPAAFGAAKSGGVVPRAAAAATEAGFAKGSIDAIAETVQDPNKSPGQKAGEIAGHGLFTAGMLTGAAHTMKPELAKAGLSPEGVAAVVENLNARRQGLPGVVEITPAMRAAAQVRAVDPAVRFENRLAELPDTELALMHEGKTNPFAKGIMAREIAARKRLNRWAPESLKPEPEPTNRAERRAAVEPEQGPVQSDFENAAWDLLDKPWEQATAEEQGAIRDLVGEKWREDAGAEGVTTGLAASKTKQSPEENPNRDYASTQVNLSGDVADAVKQEAAKIPDDVLAEDGRESQPHITVKYGLKDDKQVEIPLGGAERAALRESPRETVPLTHDDIRRAFPRAKSEQLEDGRFRVEIGGGREVVVEPGLEAIHVNVETVRRDYGRDPLPNEQAAGRYARIDRNGLVQLAKRGGDGEILNHEAFHAAVDLALTPHEKSLLEKQYSGGGRGWEEAATEAYSKLKADEPTGLLFAKIRAFFQRLWDSLSGKRNTAESVMRQVARGDVWARENVPADIKRWLLTGYDKKEGASSSERMLGIPAAHGEGWQSPLPGDASLTNLPPFAEKVNGPDPTERFAMRAEPLGILEPERPGQPPAQESAEPARTEDPRRLIVSPNADKSAINLIEKSGLSERAQLGMVDAMDAYLKAHPERKKMSDEEYRNLAREYDPNLIWALDPKKITADKLPPREAMEAARGMLSTVTAEIDRLTKKLDGPMVEQDRVGYEGELTRLKADQDHLLNIILPVRSEHGRNLRLWAQQALTDLDPAAWIARARREAGLKSGVALPGNVEAEIKGALSGVRNAEADAVQEVVTIERGRRKLAEGVEKFRERKAAERGVVELTPEQKLAQARKREITRLKAELEGKRLRNALTDEQRQALAEDPEIRDLRERVHEQRVKSKPVKTTEERVAAAIERERKRLSRRLEGEETGARPDKLTEDELRQVGEDPVVQSLRARIQQRMADERAARKLASDTQKSMLREAAAMPEAQTEQAIQRAVEQADRATAKEIGVLGDRPVTKKELTPEQQARVNKDPRVLAAKRKLFEAMKKSQRQSKLEVISAVRRAGLLTSPKTWLRNIGGNTAFAAAEEVSRIPAAVVDASLSVFTGQRTVQGASFDAVRKASYEAATKGVEEAKEVMRQGVTNEQLGRYDFRREMNSGSQVLDAYVNTVLRGMAAQDRVFKRYAIERSLQEQMKLAGVDRPTEAMEAQAIADAEFATFNNRNELSAGFSQWKANRSAPVRFAAEMIIPFSQTPSNVVLRGLDYTPIGAVGRMVGAALKADGFTPEFQRAVSLAIGRGMAGSALLLTGYALAKSGMATGNRPQNLAEVRADETARRQWGAVKLGDHWTQLTAISPVGALLTTGAALYEAAHDREGGDPDEQFWKRVAAGSGAIVKTVADMPMLQGAGMVKDFMDRPASIGRTMGRMAGSFVPTAAADLSAMADPSRRDARGFWAQVASRTPARMALPERVDALGQTVEQNRFQLVDPTLSQRAAEDSDPLLKAIVDEQMTFGQPVRREGESEEAYRWRLKVLGAFREYKMRQAMGADAYNAAAGWRQGSEDRREMLSDAARSAANTLNRELGRDYGQQPPEEQMRRLDEARIQ